MKDFDTDKQNSVFLSVLLLGIMVLVAFAVYLSLGECACG